MPSQRDITQMLREGRGDPEVLNQLMALVYEELRRLADRYLRRERPDHTLQATALVHEAYLRLVDQRNVQWQNRAHFFAIAAHFMRRILVDYTRQQRAVKRGGPMQKLSLDAAVGLPDERDVGLEALEDALMGLEAIDPQQGRIVELRFFGGLTIEETAEALDLSPATVKNKWNLARAWLHREIRRGGQHES